MIRSLLLAALIIGAALPTTAQGGGSMPPGNPPGPTPPSEFEFELQWARFDPGCDDGAATLVSPCGDHGIYYFAPTQLPACPQRAGRNETVPGYGPTVSSTPYPNTAESIFDRLAAQTGAPWVAVVDIERNHSDAVAGWIEQLDTSPARPAVTHLGDPALQSLGDTMTDFHLLAALCPILDAVDQGGTRPPTVLNLSLGRAVDAGDPIDASCTTGDVACEVAQVLSALDANGVVSVASAGNQRDELFPGSLAGVIDVGMLDVQHLLTEALVVPAWETPAGASAHFPGQSLCVGSWPTESGSSFSTATLTALLTEALLDGANPQGATQSIWSIGWNDVNRCWDLRRDGTAVTPCSAAIDQIVLGLGGDYAQQCWSDGAGTTVSTTLDFSAVPTWVPTHASWAASIRPTPEADPCVPCVGDESEEEEEALDVNTSQASPQPPGTTVDTVYLRSGTQFIQLRLSAEDLAALAAGTITTLRISGIWSYLQSSKYQPSLVFVLADDGADCEHTPTECYWLSSPITLR